MVQTRNKARQAGLAANRTAIGNAVSLGRKMGEEVSQGYRQIATTHNNMAKQHLQDAVGGVQSVGGYLGEQFG